MADPFFNRKDRETQAHHAVAQFKEKFENLDECSQQQIFRSILWFIRNIEIDSSINPPVCEQHKMVEIYNHFELYHNCITFDIRWWSWWWQTLSTMCCSVTLMEFIKLTFHDIVIPDFDDVDTCDQETETVPGLSLIHI